MASVLFKNALLPGVSERCALIVSEDRISFIGQTLPVGQFDRVIDARGHLLLPGFINTHGHAAMTLLRGVGSDLPLEEWLNDKIWPLEAKLTPEDVYWGSLLAIVEMLKSGTTTFADMYFFEEEVARAVMEGGIRAVLSRGVVGVGPDTLKKFDESAEFIRTWHGGADGRITTMLGPHAPYTNPPESMYRILEDAAALEVPIQIHLCETAKEVENSLREYGKTPVGYVDSLGMLEFPVLAAHCVHLSETDMNILARKDVRIAHNPGSNLKLGSGIAPIPELLARGMTVGLGTDGAASNNNLDMLEEMRLAALIHKGARQQPTLIGAGLALSMATEMGARALFLDEQVGRLEVGMKADLVMLDLEKPHLTPLHDAVAHLVYAAAATDINLVMVDGRILVENGQVTTIDEEKVIFNARRIAKRLGS